MEQIPQNSTTYWLVVYSTETGDFKNASVSISENLDIDTISELFEKNNPEYRVIHIGEGESPPKTYRALEYIDNFKPF